MADSSCAATAPAQMWVAISAPQLLEADFVERVAGLVTEHELVPGSLGLVIR